MFIDTHMHCLEGSFDSFIKLTEIVKKSKEMGLDAICITDHDNNNVLEYAKKISFEHNFNIFVGVEILTYEGDILVWGLEKSQQKMHAQELIKLVKKNNGVCVAAHPFRENNRGAGKYLKELKGLDGIETFNGSTKAYNNLYAYAHALELNLATLAGSDCHTLDSIGRYCTYFKNDIHSINDLIKEIKSRNTFPAVYKDGKYEIIKTFGKYGQIF